MKQLYPSCLLRPARWVLAAALLGAGVAACTNETEQLPNPGPEYYPLEVGAYRIYDVADTTWRNNVPTASRFQFREQVAAELSPDATGQPVYRVVRSRRATPADAWAVDSVLTVTVGQRYLAEQRNNRRSVELVFPVEENKSWSNTAFYAPDTAKVVNTAPTRFYRQVGEAFSITRSGKTYAYDNTISTINDLNSATGVTACGVTIIRTTFAAGVGPVYRVKRRFDFDSKSSAACVTGFVYLGQSRSEVLIESGK